MNAIQPGTYVVAVSGGVDSMVLLDLLRRRPELRLVVAHVDHGIRSDSAEDRRLVEQTAAMHGLPFVYTEAKLGNNTSEESARNVRYEFLHNIRKQSDARAIITAHHQDDALETAILNLLRGTGRKGLSSLGSNDALIRPMLHVPKATIRQYAEQNGVAWREDSTNEDTRFTRNYIRRFIMPRLTPEGRTELIKILRDAQERNHHIDARVIDILHQQPSHAHIKRSLFLRLRYAEACEVMAVWLRNHDIRSFDRRTIDRLVIAAKTFRAGQRTDINRTHFLEIEKDYLKITAVQR